MKNQYFGDVNDYRKYGLLRILSDGCEMKLGVCWMLTKDDQRSDGQFRNYLHNAAKFREHDSCLFEWLQEGVGKDDVREVQRIEKSGLLGASTQFHTDLLTDSASERTKYFTAWNRKSFQCDIVFFDPDNGIEVKVKKGESGSHKYVYYDELKTAYDNGSSVAIYQHFIREKRNKYINRISASLCEQLNPATVFSFRTPHVLFLLAAQAKHVEHFRQKVPIIANRWQSAKNNHKAQIIPSEYMCL